MATLISSKPSRMSSFVRAMPSIPESLTHCRVSTASNQPQRRGRPVLVPNSLPRWPRRRPISSYEFGRERAAADARRIGLGDAQHVADRAGTEPRAGRGVGRHGVRRRDVRVGAMVDVEQRALGALEQDALAGAARAVEQLDRSPP